MTSTKGSVLVVDDDAESRRIIANILTGEGYRVRQADSAGAALASIRTDPPDLMLLDIRTTAMDGFAVNRLLKADETSGDIPLMLLGGLTDQEERAKGFALGAVDFVGKPVCSAELLARVATHLELG